MNKIVVMIQYVGHVVNAQGSVTYRTIELELTKEQIQKLKLQQDEYYGPIAIEIER
jgi:hypothetical protein